ncbi:flagellar biosynthesis protein FlhA [Crocinitomicaceae bacterium]|nr:flagellar biosynthesis protein FlhA [Crocinitomicaceae bacterium]MDB4606301.1 flagellar biosynthesis protein FlhA [Crocinitomicaceae bacterium]
MEDKIDSIYKKVNFIVGVIVFQILVVIGFWIYNNSPSIPDSETPHSPINKYHDESE